MATPQTFSLKVGESIIAARVQRDGAHLLVTIGDVTHVVQARAGLDGRLDLDIDGRRTRAYVAGGDEVRYIAVDGDVWPVTRVESTARGRGRPPQRQGALTATMPALVLDVLVAPGDEVDAGTTLVLLEAMKMELRLTAPHAGRVRSVHCEAGVVVARGQLLVDLEGEIERNRG